MFTTPDYPPLKWEDAREAARAALWKREWSCIIEPTEAMVELLARELMASRNGASA